MLKDFVLVHFFYAVKAEEGDVFLACCCGNKNRLKNFVTHFYTVLMVYMSLDAIGNILAMWAWLYEQTTGMALV